MNQTIQYLACCAGKYQGKPPEDFQMPGSSSGKINKSLPSIADTIPCFTTGKINTLSISHFQEP